MKALPLVLAMTGASGAPYAVRLLEVLAANRVPVWLIVSKHGWRLLEEESGIGSLSALKSATGGAKAWARSRCSATMIGARVRRRVRRAPRAW